MPSFLQVLKIMKAWRRYIIAIMTPTFLSLLFLYDGTEYQKPARCTFVLLILVVFWTSECLPIAVTGLLPMFLYPLLKIVSAKELAHKYMNEVIMAFMGSYIMVIAFERANLHKRLALRILRIVGPQPRWLLFGCMMSACFLSMFTNNAVSCALHLPIVKGIIDELREAAKKQQKIDKNSCANLKECATEVTTIASMPSLPEMGVEASACETSFTTNPEQEDATGERKVRITIPSDDDVAQQEPDDDQEVPPDYDYYRKTSKDVILENGGGHVKTSPTSSNDSIDKPSTSQQTSAQDDEENALSHRTITRLEKMLLLAAAYSASIGGMCTLIGTPTNLIMKERVEEVFPHYNCTTHPVTFTSWLVIGFPVGYIFIFFAWFWLQLLFLGPKYVYRVWIYDSFQCLRQTESRAMIRRKIKAQKQAERVTAVIEQLHAQLEPMGFQQYAVLVHCLLLVLLLITRQMSTGDSHDYVGWGIVAPDYVEESTAAILITASMFLFPSKWPTSSDAKPPPALLKWKFIEESFPFGVILLLGGGMAATHGAQESGLPLVIAPIFRNMLQDSPLQLAVLVTSVFVATLTEVMSNVACFTLISPVMEELAFELHVNPLLFLFPTTLSASFAFMLPVATLPNALVFSTNRLKIRDMVLAGLGMNTIGVFIVFVAINTWASSYFSLFSPPCSH